jgi:hypothetical protein
MEIHCFRIANIDSIECKESKGCAPVKHHFDECVERVTGAHEGKAADKKLPHEDCVEECTCYFFAKFFLHQTVYCSSYNS